MKGKIASGKVIQKEGKYYLEAEGKTEELSFAHVPAAQLKELEGQEVEVILSAPKPSIIGIYRPARPRPWCFILCYKPVDLGQLIIPEVELAQNLLDKFVSEGLITQEIRSKLTK